jgi:5'-methylthioadenosine phosphorylase
MVGLLEGRRVAFLARHARGHRLLPSEVPFQANVFAMKLLGRGADPLRLRGGLAEGAVRADAHGDPRPVRGPHVQAHLDLLRARPGGATWPSPIRSARRCAACSSRPAARPRSSGTEGDLRLHRGPAVLHAGGVRAVPVVGHGHHRHDQHPGGAPGPRGRDLLRTLAMVTDYDCWHPGHDSVTADQIIATLVTTRSRPRRSSAGRCGASRAEPRTCECATALARPGHAAELVPDDVRRSWRRSSAGT